MPRILSGRYCGSLEDIMGQRGMLLNADKHALYSEDTDPLDIVFVQWDHLPLWEEIFERTGLGWEEFLMEEFDEFCLETDEIARATYMGGLDSIKDKRCRIMTPDGSTLDLSYPREETVLVKWDDPDLHEYMGEVSPGGWHKHIFGQFGKFEWTSELGSA